MVVLLPITYQLIIKNEKNKKKTKNIQRVQCFVNICVAPNCKYITGLQYLYHIYKLDLIPHFENLNTSNKSSF